MTSIRITILFLLLISIILPTFSVAQVVIEEPEEEKPNIEEIRNANINYIPRGEVKWILESTNDDEIVEVEKVTGKSSRFTIHPTDKLSLDQQQNYPVEIFRLEYDELGNVSRKIDYETR